MSRIRKAIRTEKQAVRWRKKLERYRSLHKQISENAPDILCSDNFLRTKLYLQHGNMSVNAHVLSVCRYSIALSEVLHIECNRRDLIRGALLHDYFLYDWHRPDVKNPHRLHGFFHPGRALRNADREFRLTGIQKDIISKHMWPLTVVPPLCREAWIVTAADKWCSFMETIRMHRGHGVALNYINNTGYPIGFRRWDQSCQRLGSSPDAEAAKQQII